MAAYLANITPGIIVLWEFIQFMVFDAPRYGLLSEFCKDGHFGIQFIITILFSPLLRHFPFENRYRYLLNNCVPNPTIVICPRVCCSSEKNILPFCLLLVMTLTICKVEIVLQ